MRFNFVDVVMHGTDIHSADMRNAKFNDVNLSGASFENISFKDAKFHDVNMSGVVIEDANIDGMTVLGHDIKKLIEAENARK